MSGVRGYEGMSGVRGCEGMSGVRGYEGISGVRGCEEMSGVGMSGVQKVVRGTRTGIFHRKTCAVLGFEVVENCAS